MRNTMVIFLISVSFGLLGCSQEAKEEISVPATTAQQPAEINTMQQAHPAVADNSVSLEQQVEPAQSSQNATDDIQDQQPVAVSAVAAPTPQTDSIEHDEDSQVTTQEGSPADNNETANTTSATE